jgi:hypothetical protein
MVTMGILPYQGIEPGTSWLVDRNADHRPRGWSDKEILYTYIEYVVLVHIINCNHKAKILLRTGSYTQGLSHDRKKSELTIYSQKGKTDKFREKWDVNETWVISVQIGQERVKEFNDANLPAMAMSRPSEPAFYSCLACVSRATSDLSMKWMCGGNSNCLVSPILCFEVGLQKTVRACISFSH